MFGTGTVLAALSMLPPQPATVNRLGILAVAFSAGVAALLVPLAGPRYSVRMSHAFSAAGSVMIALIVAMGGGTFLSVVYAAMFVWVAQFAAVFYGWRAALAHVTLGALAHAVALSFLPAGPRLVTWGMTLATALVVIFCYRLFDRMSARLRALVEYSGGVIVIVDRGLAVTCQRGPVQRLLGYDDDLVGTQLLSLVHPDDRQAVAGLLPRTADDRAAATVFEARLTRSDGSWLHAELTVETAFDDPAVGGLVLTMRDVTERKQLEEQLVHQAFHDPLTGLANRALFSDRVEHALSRRRHADHTLAVVFIDLDDFKTVNDSLGHAAGDDLLSILAGRLTATVRGGDTVARLGGDEFAILLEDVSDPEMIRELATRLHDALALPVQLGSVEVVAGASIGAASSGPGTQRAADLLRNADGAMYQAKQEGKGRFRQFDPTMHGRMLHRLQLKADLRHAVERGQLRIQYQPTVALRTGQVQGVEALLRWDHPALGTVPPNEFIPLAEETGTITDIGRWVLRTSCAQARRWQDLQPDSRPISVHVNVSGHQLQRDDFVGHVEDALADSGLAPSDLILEITETVLLEDLDTVIGRLQRLRRLGVRVAIDDFGAGYSSLGYLHKLPVDLIKVDKSFVDAIADDEVRTRGLVETIVRMGRVLGIPAVAEGIELERQAQALQEMGCDYGQGYLLARPMDTAATTDFLADRRRVGLRAVV